VARNDTVTVFTHSARVDLAHEQDIYLDDASLVVWAKRQSGSARCSKTPATPTKQLLRLWKKFQLLDKV